MSVGVAAHTFEADKAHMRRAIELAWLGKGWTNPNPLVGAVVVKDGRVIGEGYHARYGQAHAERNALASCAVDPRGATMYVTLEPCCHQGKQPPCTTALIDAGIARVVVGSRDPNPLVSGKGNAILRASGVQVVEDVLRGECDELNSLFFHYIQTGRPYVVAKWAMTLDGKIATSTGNSRWVSNEQSRADVHDLRHQLAAIMVGIGTVLADDPSLTARRGPTSRQPLRVVADSHLRIPLDGQLVQTAGDFPTLVATTVREDDTRAQALRECGVDIVSVPGADGKVDLDALLDRLGERDIDSLLIEGGGSLNEAMFKSGLVNEVIVYLAPKVVGGGAAKTPVEGEGVSKMADAFLLGTPRIERFGSDLKLTYKLDKGTVPPAGPEAGER